MICKYFTMDMFFKVVKEKANIQKLNDTLYNYSPLLLYCLMSTWYQDKILFFIIHLIYILNLQNFRVQFPDVLIYVLLQYSLNQNRH